MDRPASVSLVRVKVPVELLAHDEEYLGRLLKHWLQENRAVDWIAWDDSEIRGVRAVIRDLQAHSKFVA